MFEHMGKNATGEKTKFDLITASKTKKYKIVTAVILVLGVLLMGGGFLLRSLNTSAVTPNNLTITELSGLDGTERYYTCTISIDSPFVLTTGTPKDHPLANPITFTLDADAQSFLQVCDKNYRVINSYNYQGQFYLHIRTDITVPEFLDNGERPTGTLTIRCGTHVIIIKITYHHVDL